MALRASRYEAPPESLIVSPSAIGGEVGLRESVKLGVNTRTLVVVVLGPVVLLVVEPLDVVVDASGVEVVVAAVDVVVAGVEVVVGLEVVVPPIADVVVTDVELIGAVVVMTDELEVLD